MLQGSIDVHNAALLPLRSDHPTTLLSRPTSRGQHVRALFTEANPGLYTSAVIRSRLRRSIKPLRWWARIRCVFPLHDGVTVIIVNWNSLDLLRHSVGAVRRFSVPGTRIIVVDNGSDDGSKEWLSGQPDIAPVVLDKNWGHAPGLEIGALSARTKTIVALDVDAFPISPDWLDVLLTPLAHGAQVSGVAGGSDHRATFRIENRNDAWADRPSFVHPCCLAIHLRRFIYRNHTFQRVQLDDRLADPAEAIAWRELGNLHLLDLTSVRGPGTIGQVHGGIVYHNAYGTRHRKEGRELVDGVAQDDALSAWDEAVERYLTNRSTVDGRTGELLDS